MDAPKVGDTAGKIWKHLAKEPKTPLKALPKLLGVDADTVTMAIGWLLREGKLKMDKTGKDTLLSLEDGEIKPQ